LILKPTPEMPEQAQ